MIYYLIKCICLNNCLSSTYRRYYLRLIDTITNTFVIFIIDTNTNTNVSTILIFCLNRYCIGDTAQLCI